MWFLGAGCSRTANLPTATDIIWDLKRKFYNQEENQSIKRQDLQNEAVKLKIQNFMDGRGFPPLWSNQEYSLYFEKIFGDDRERQRKYIKDILSEDNVRLSVGNRVLGALICANLAKLIFTTNFDTVVEDSVAKMGGKALSPFHIEGSTAALSALNNEEYPIYCKLHGDFRYLSIKNLEQDLVSQNAALADCFVNAASRFGMIVAGYSGRDESIIKLFSDALDRGNAFPHGLYWTGIEDNPVNPSLTSLISKAHTLGVNFNYVKIDTFDAFMLKIWRRLEAPLPELDAKVRKSQAGSVAISIPNTGQGQPIIRFNAIPLIEMPKTCPAFVSNVNIEWSELRKAQNDCQGKVTLAKEQNILFWGNKLEIEKAFKGRIAQFVEVEIAERIKDKDSTILKSFLEENICKSLIRNRPLLSRTSQSGSFIIIDAHATDQSEHHFLKSVLKKLYGEIVGIFAPKIGDHLGKEKIYWTEAIQVSIQVIQGRTWLIIEPAIWVWPTRARILVKDFIKGKQSDRNNKAYNSILTAWINLLFDSEQKNLVTQFKPFENGNDLENPTFAIGNKTAYARRLS